MPDWSTSELYLVDPQTGGIVAAGEHAGPGSEQPGQPLDHLDRLSQGLAETIVNRARKGEFPIALGVEISEAKGNFPAHIVVHRLRGKRGEFLLVEVSRRPVSGTENWLPDAVTGLPDRRALAKHRAKWAAAASPVPHAVLFLDLDGFKLINDEHGHASGDRMLAELAGRWRRCLREEDLVVRYGGDEFVVLLGQIASRADVEPIIKRLEAVTRQPFQIGGYNIEISVTVGVALARDGATPLETLIADADRDMYAAKSRRTP